MVIPVTELPFVGAVIRNVFSLHGLAIFKLSDIDTATGFVTPLTVKLTVPEFPLVATAVVFDYALSRHRPFLELALVMPTRRRFELTMAVPVAFLKLAGVDHATGKFLNAFTVKVTILNITGIGTAVRKAGVRRKQLWRIAGGEQKDCDQRESSPQGA